VVILQIAIWVAIGMAKGMKDLSTLNRFKKSFWNKGQSWMLKWERNYLGYQIRQSTELWYYLWRWTPEYKERFPYSSTILVFLTDGWHLLGFIKYRLAILSVSMLGEAKIPMLLITAFGVTFSVSGVLLYVGISTCFSIGFWIIYEKKADYEN